MISIAQCLGIGTVVGCWAGLTEIPIPIAILVAGTATAMAHSDLPIRQVIQAALLTVCVAGFGMWRVTTIPYSSTLGRHQTVEIQAIDASTPRFWRASALTLNPGNSDLKRFRLTVSSASTPQPQPGQVIDVVGKWKGSIPVSNPGQQDFQAWQRAQRISGHLSVTKWYARPDIAPSQIRWGAVLRHRLVSRIQQALPNPHASVIAAIILGDSGISIPHEIERQFKRAGLTHLLVVSGSQVSLVLGLGIGALVGLRVNRGWQLTLGTILNLVVYGVSGGGVSILRAVIMSQVMITGRWIRQSTNPLELLWLTVGVMGWIDPTTIVHPGTLLSFAATIGLAIGVPQVASMLPDTWSDRVKTTVSVAVVPTMVTTPIVATLSHTASPVGILANLVAIPLVEVSVIVGLISTLVASIGIPVIGDWGLWITYASVSALMMVAEWASNLPWATVGIGGLWGIAPIALLGLILTWLIPDQVPNHRVRSGVMIALLVMIGIMVVKVATAPSQFRVVILDVGQGDATLIQSPGGQTILIDTGKPGMGDQVITPALRYYGITTLDTLIITHFDDDHMGGAAEVITEFSPKEIITNGRGIITSRDITAPHVQTIPLNGGGIIQLMYPNPIENIDDNNHSVCALVKWNTMSWLITGDLEADGERALIAQFGSDLQARVLKLGHHGSKTSTTLDLLTTTQPALAIASAGRRNRYGHPHPVVLSRLAQAGIPVLRTDQDGAVEFSGSTIRLWAKPANTLRWYER